ncbi:hypothetical protein KKG51_03085 [Patescibacteria group bacterium]|nr:hypothetical protein [Patescibacteria group bacterium]
MMDFFKELENLMHTEPRIALNNVRAVNSEYANACINNKNCYMIFGSDHNEDCLYSTWMYDCKDSVDCSFIRDSQLCYECTDCAKCYNAKYLQDCDNCRDSEYLYGCTGCDHCFCCAGLFRKSYCVKNKQCERDEYFEKVEKMKKEGNIEKEFENVQLKTPRRFAHALDNEDCTGDYICHCKNTHDSFDVQQCWDCGYLANGVYGIKDCYDVSYLENAEMCYEGISNWGFDMNFCNYCWFCSGMEYCDTCYDCKNCYGCVCLKNKQYHILNKPYKKDEYEKKVKEIKDQLKREGKYGRVFIQSPYAFDQTIASDYYPSC